MERKQIANVVVPAVAVAAVIGVVGLAFTLGGGPGMGGPVDTSAAGMSDKKPPLDAKEWTDIGNGLKTWDVVEGTGAQVDSPGMNVKVHYSGWLTDGTEFDSSVHKGQPIEFPLNGVILGWTRGIPGMKVGGIRRLYIPWDMAYGATGKPPAIPAKADLVFEVKLIRCQ